MMATVRLGPEIVFALEMKGQVLHRTRAHFNVLLTRKLFKFLSRLYEMRSGCVKISAVVGSC